MASQNDSGRGVRVHLASPHEQFGSRCFIRYAFLQWDLVLYVQINPCNKFCDILFFQNNNEARIAVLTITKANFFVWNLLYRKTSSIRNILLYLKKEAFQLIPALLNTDVFYRLGSSCSRRRSQQSHHQEVESPNGLEKFGGILQI